MAEINIKSVGYAEIGRTRQLFNLSENLPFGVCTEVARERLAGYHFAKSGDALRSGKIQVFAAEVEDRPTALLLLENLEWDTEVLGLSCFGIRDLIVPEGPAQEKLDTRLIDFAVEHCSAEGGELLVAKTDPASQHLVRAFGVGGFELVSTLLVHGFDTRRGEIPSAKGMFTYRPFVEKEIDAIEDLAREAFAGHFDRYTLDKRIPKESRSRVHCEWVRNSCHGYADQVFVALDNEKVVGFGTWRIEKGVFDALGLRIAKYDLAAVSPDYWGRGIYKGLAATGLQWINGKVDVILGPANIRNYAVHRGLGSLGWHIVGGSYSYHKWLK